MLIDFTNCKQNIFKAYGGANGNKISVQYNGADYMLKFPPQARRNPAMSYSNGCISEYIACHIFESLGFKTQETLLGTYTDGRGKEKLVVACKDFTDGGKRLIEFAQLKNTCIDSEQSGYGTELDSILDAIDEQKMYPRDELREFFWDMFIADALLGNFDRHNGNWGLLIDDAAQRAEIAPIYDCGSCLFPQLDLSRMEDVLNNDEEIEKRIYQFPTSALQINGQKINYYSYISSFIDDECTAALRRVGSRIDMGAISDIIDETPTILPIQKDFYKIIIRERHEYIIEQNLDRILAQEQEQIHNEHQGFEMRML